MLEGSFSLYTLLVWVSICLYPTNVKKAEPIGAQILCGTSHDPREGFWNIKIGRKKIRKNIVGFILNAPIQKGFSPKFENDLRWFFRATVESALKAFLIKQIQKLKM